MSVLFDPPMGNTAARRWSSWTCPLRLVSREYAIGEFMQCNSAVSETAKVGSRVPGAGLVERGSAKIRSISAPISAPISPFEARFDLGAPNSIRICFEFGHPRPDTAAPSTGRAPRRRRERHVSRALGRSGVPRSPSRAPQSGVEAPRRAARRPKPARDPHDRLRPRERRKPPQTKRRASTCRATSTGAYVHPACCARTRQACRARLTTLGHVRTRNV